MTPYNAVSMQKILAKLKLLIIKLKINYTGYSWWLSGKESTCLLPAGDMGSTPGPRRSHMLWSKLSLCATSTELVC